MYDVQLKQDCGLTIAQYGLLSGCAALSALRWTFACMTAASCTMRNLPCIATNIFKLLRAHQNQSWRQFAQGGACVCIRYANGLVYAFASLILGYCVDHLNWPRTWLLVAANVLLALMYVLEVRPGHGVSAPATHRRGLYVCMASYAVSTVWNWPGACLFVATAVLPAGLECD